MKLYQHKTPAVLSAALDIQYNEFRFFFGIDVVLYKRPWVIT